SLPVSQNRLAPLQRGRGSPLRLSGAARVLHYDPHTISAMGAGLPHSTLCADEPREFAGVVVEAGEDGLQVGDADVLGEDLAEHGAKIRAESEVAALIELMVVQAGPLAVDLPAGHVAAHHEHAICVAVVGAPVAVLARGAAEFAHGDENDVLHAVGQVLMKRRETLAEIAQQIRELPLHATFVDVIVPAAAIHKQNFHADVGFQKLAYLLQALPEAAR